MGRLITLFFAGVFLLGVTGCGPVDDVTDESSVIDQVFPPAGNDLDEDADENPLGWYGPEALFANKKIVEGVWSVYIRTDFSDENPEFYDLYERGYDFRSDGTAFTRKDTKTFSSTAQWGVDPDGTELALDDGYVYIYDSVFANDELCFKVLQNVKTVRFCKEPFVDQNNSNTAGFFGSNVYFGNRTNYNFKAEGTWLLSGYDVNPAPETAITLNANGLTSGGGEWGVSKDGKVMTIDGVGYLVNRYLRSPDENCIAVIELSGDIIMDTVWKLCKQ